MEKQTLYEILEVSENASSEIIEKAYKVLAKKYHPDLQDIGEKQKAEEKMKKINEAYEILGNAEKKIKYDEELKQKREAERYCQEQNFQNTRREEKTEYYSENYSSNISKDNTEKYNYEKERLKYEERLRREENIRRKEMQENLNREYENAYYNYLRSLGYRIRHKWTKENIFDFFIVLVIMAIIITALWFIPTTHDWIVKFYEQNPILKIIVDIIVGIVKGLVMGIWNFITGLFA